MNTSSESAPPDFTNHVCSLRQPLSQTWFEYAEAPDAKTWRRVNVNGSPGQWHDHLGCSVERTIEILYSSPSRFNGCREADEIYTVLFNAAHYLEQGFPALTVSCLEGVIKDCEVWMRQIAAQEKKAKKQRDLQEAA
jgi:hypothetical protein